MSSQWRMICSLFQWVIGFVLFGVGMSGGQVFGSSDRAVENPTKNSSVEQVGKTQELSTGGITQPAQPAGQDLFFFQPPASDKPTTSSMMEHTEPAPLSDKAPIELEADVPVLAESVVEESFVDPFEDPEAETIEDPWEPFNSSMFTFNRQLDIYAMKPVAKGYNHVIPYEIQRSLDRIFDNIRIVPRLVNTLAQAKWRTAGRVMSRFLINSTIGVGGMFDVAGEMFDIKDSDFEDMGQTLAFHGVPSGPYLVIPFLPPTTVRDGIGQLVDSFLNPLNYFLPLAGQLGWRGEEAVNDRSLNLELFEGVEESTVDLYGAVREAYIQKRSQAIKE